MMQIIARQATKCREQGLEWGKVDAGKGQETRE
jgi:hypothetical protein